jgi:hypothetical protein
MSCHGYHLEAAKNGDEVYQNASAAERDRLPPPAALTVGSNVPQPPERLGGSDPPGAPAMVNRPAAGIP